MNRLPLVLVASAGLLAGTLGTVPRTASAASVLSDVEIRLKDGSSWRGDVGDEVKITFLERGVEVTMTGRLAQAEPLYVVIEGELAGRPGRKVVMRTDVVRMSSAGAASGQDAARPDRERARPARDARTEARDDVPRDDMGRELGVFVLPLEGGVGQTFRHDEIEAIGKKADEHGPGQTIVLIIDSNGGLVLESLEINKTIHEVRKRHRVVAWIRKAISAGCSTAMACEEIYFMSEGAAGSVTTVRGTQSLDEEEAAPHVEDFVRLARASGYNEWIAWAMKLNKYMVSYTKDPDTGEITWYGGVEGEWEPGGPGEVILSDENQNLSFNASNALACGFSKGTADTPEELAKLLGLPRWHEISDYGRQIAKEWQETHDRVTERLQKIRAELQYKNTSSGDQRVVLRTRIKLLEEVLRYVRDYPLLTLGINEQQIEREIEQMKRQLAMMNRR